MAYLGSEDKELASAAKVARDALITLESADVNFLQAKRHFRAVQMARGFQPVGSPGQKGGGKKGKRRKGKGRSKDFKGGKDSFYADDWYDWEAEAWAAYPEYADDAYVASAGLRCADCSRLGHANSSAVLPSPRTSCSLEKRLWQGLQRWEERQKGRWQRQERPQSPTHCASRSWILRHACWRHALLHAMAGLHIV